MVFGKWAEEYMQNYPGLYHEVTVDEARDLIEEFDRRGFQRSRRTEASSSSGTR